MPGGGAHTFRGGTAELSAGSVACFAELVSVCIDELSAASAAGQADDLVTTRGGAAALPRAAAAAPHRPRCCRRPGAAVVQGRESYARALRAVALDLSSGSPRGPEPLDTEQHLPELILDADRAALADLRAQVLAPLAHLRPATAQRLAGRLRASLLYRGRRDEVAAARFVHPQTVRYRMQQLRDLYGDRLDDPDWVLRLILAVAVVTTGHPCT